MTQVATITAALEQFINGEPSPSFGSPEFRKLLSALTALTVPGIRIDPKALLMHEQVGRAAMSLLLDHLMASMTAERAVAIMRSDKPDAVC
jgi:hypothetical protein